MYKDVVSPSHSWRRNTICTLAWSLAVALLLTTVLAAVRLDPLTAANFDRPILLKLNEHVVQSAPFNSFMSKLFEMPITSGVLLVAPLWYLWFETRSKPAQAKLSCGRHSKSGLQIALPTHPRPLDDPALGFNLLPGRE